MKLLDLNLLLYAVNRDSAAHTRAKAWIEDAFSGEETIALPWVVILLSRALLAEAGTAGNLTTDAHLATLAIEHDAELCSSDGDFARFAGLRWMNPLAG